MDFKNICSDVRKLSVITEGWCKRGMVDEIERALVLDKLKSLYERVMFMEPEEVLEDAGSEEDPEVEVEFLFPEEAEAELSSDVEEDTVVPSAGVEEEPEAAEDSPVEIAETAEPAREVVAEASRKEEVRLQPEQPRFNEQSLFDLDQIPVRRTSRDVLLSLYSDEEDDVPAVSKTEERPIEVTEPLGVAEQEEAASEVLEPENLAGSSVQEPVAEVYEQEVMLEDAVSENPEESESLMPESTDIVAANPEETVESLPESEYDEEADDNGSGPETADEEEEPFIDLEVAHGSADDFDAEDVRGDEQEYYEDDDDEDFNIIEISDEDEDEGHATVLGDVMMENSAPALGDTFHAARTVENGPVRSLKGSIGLNDKFMIIRTLFGGDAELYEHTIDELEEFTDLDEALLYLHDNFRWKPDNEGVNMLVGLLMRKLS